MTEEMLDSLLALCAAQPKTWGQVKAEDWWNLTPAQQQVLMSLPRHELALEDFTQDIPVDDEDFIFQASDFPVSFYVNTGGRGKVLYAFEILRLPKEEVAFNDEDIKLSVVKTAFTDDEMWARLEEYGWDEEQSKEGGVYWPQAHVETSDMAGIDFGRNAVLWEANFYGTDFSKAILRGADLTWAVLEEANLRDADLRGACLSGANLTGADLRGTKLFRAKVEGTVWEGATADFSTVWPEGFNVAEAGIEMLEGGFLEEDFKLSIKQAAIEPNSPGYQKGDRLVSTKSFIISFAAGLFDPVDYQTYDPVRPTDVRFFEDEFRYQIMQRDTDNYYEWLPGQKMEIVHWTGGTARLNRLVGDRREGFPVLLTTEDLDKYFRPADPVFEDEDIKLSQGKSLSGTGISVDKTCQFSFPDYSEIKSGDRYIDGEYEVEVVQLLLRPRRLEIKRRLMGSKLAQWEETVIWKDLFEERLKKGIIHSFDPAPEGTLVSTPREEYLVDKTSYDVSIQPPDAGQIGLKYIHNDPGTAMEFPDMGQLCPYEHCQKPLVLPNDGWFLCGACRKPLLVEEADSDYEDFHCWRTEEVSAAPPKSMVVAKVIEKAPMVGE